MPDSFELVVLVGAAKVTDSDLRGLRVQDVVLLEWCTAATAEEPLSAGIAGAGIAGVVRCGRRLFFTILNEKDGRSLAVLGREQVLRGPDDYLFVELTRVTLTKEEARALKKGSVVDLGPESQEALWLQYGGRLIGRCECVEINGKPGARVTELL